MQPYYTVTPYEALSERLSAPGVEVSHEVGVPAYKMLPLLSKLIKRPDDSKAIGGIMRFYNSPPKIWSKALICLPEVSSA